ncbi:MAG: hypothetical protein U1E52_06080 [Geminicoccaceae bacterium]
MAMLRAAAAELTGCALLAVLAREPERPDDAAPARDRGPCASTAARV